MCLLTTTTFEPLQSVGGYINLNQLDSLNFTFLSPSPSSFPLTKLCPQPFSQSFPPDNMTSPPSSPNPASASDPQPPTPSSSKPLPSQPAPTLPPQDEIIDLSQAFEADEALSNPSGPSVDPNPISSALTPELQARIERNKREAQRRRQAFDERQRHAKKPRVNPPAPSPPSQPAMPPFRAFVTYEGRQHEFCTACARITDLVVAPPVRICPTCKRAFICEKCRMPL